MHDDQHGTAIISAAGLINALQIVGKKIEDVKVVVNGAGAAAISCTRLYMRLGVKRERHHGRLERPDQDGPSKPDGAETRSSPPRADVNSLAEALVGADVFLGLSVAGVLTQEMVRSMAKDPIVFALANPQPEISPEDARAQPPRPHLRHRPLRPAQPD